jgi:hypothetical protein
MMKFVNWLVPDGSRCHCGHTAIAMLANEYDHAEHQPICQRHLEQYFRQFWYASPSPE